MGLKTMLAVRKHVAPVGMAIFASLLFALLVANLTFDFRLSRESSDIYSYIRNYDRYERVYYRLSMSELELLLYEVHFHYWFQELSDYIGDPIDVLRGITFLSCFTFAFSSMSRSSWRLVPVLLILSHPRFLDFVSSQQRLAFALSICVLAILFFGFFLARAVFFLVAASFHTYVVVLLSATVLHTVGVWRDWRYRYVLLLGAGLVFVAVVLAPLILGILGDRRADDEGGATGILYTAMWLGTYAVFGVFYSKRLNSVFGFLFIFSALSALAAFAVDAYSERYIALSIVFMALSGVVRDLHRDSVFWVVYMLNAGVSYVYWLR